MNQEERRYKVKQFLTYQDTDMSNPETWLIRTELKDIIEGFILNLKPKRMYALCCRHELLGYDFKTYKEIAKDLNLSRSRVSQLEIRGLQDLFYNLLSILDGK